MNNRDMDAPTTNGVDREPLLAMIRELVEHGANVNARTREVPPSRRWLYSLGDVSWVDFTGQTPFLRAALSGDVAVMRLLLEHGADPNLPTQAGTTPLMAASGVNWVVAQTYTESPQSLLDAIQLCLEHGADVNAVNSMGLTAVLGAANRGANDIIRLLAANGARLDVVDKEGRSALRWAEGVFLAAVGAERKPRDDRAARGARRTASPRALTMRRYRDRRDRQRRRLAAAAAYYVFAQRTPSAADHWALVDRYCVGCHNDAELAGDLAFDRVNRDEPSGRRRGLGDGDPQAARTLDAAARRAAARGGARRRRSSAGSRNRSTRPHARRRIPARRPCTA